MDAHRPDELTVARRLDDIEQQLRRDDPSLVEQFISLEPRHPGHEVAIFVLLFATVILFATALAAMSVAAGFTGVMALFAAVLVDHRRQRRIQR